MLSRTHLRTWTAAAALLGALYATPALAGDPKVYAGSACQPVFEFYEGSNATSRLLRSNGALRNFSDKTEGLDCPIVRDRINSTKGFTATVRVKNVFGRLNIAIQSRDEFGKLVAGTAGAITDTGEQELTLVVDKSVPEGTYTLGLNLPASSEVLSYTIEELL